MLGGGGFANDNENYICISGHPIVFYVYGFEGGYV